MHLDELQIAGADTSVTNAIAGRSLEIGTVRVTADGVFDAASTCAAATVCATNAVFASGATWVIPTADTWSLPGRATFGEELTLRCARRLPRRFAALEADGGVTGDPSVTCTGAQRIFKAEENRVWMLAPATALLIQ